MRWLLQELQHSGSGVIISTASLQGLPALRRAGSARHGSNSLDYGSSQKDLIND